MGNLGIEFVIFCQKNVHAGKRAADRLLVRTFSCLRVLVDIERNPDVKRTPHANLTRNLGSLELAARIVAFLGKRLVNVCQKLGCHTNAGIRDAKAKHGVLVVDRFDGR